MIFFGYGLHQLWPIYIGKFPNFMWDGFIIAGIGFGIIVYSGISFKRAKTAIEPWKPTTQIVTQGIFAYSRNPIYIGLCIITIGIGLFLSLFWVMISFFPSAFFGLSYCH